MLAQVLGKQLGALDRHRAVQKHRQRLRDAPLLLEHRNGVQQRLRATDRKHRRHHGAAAGGCALQRFRQFVDQVLARVLAVAVGGLDEHRIRSRWCLGREHEQVVAAPEVARKQQPPPAHFEIQAGGAQNVPGSMKARLPARQRLEQVQWRHAAQLFQAFARILFGVERQRRVVFGKTLAVGELGVFFLDVAAVGQQDAAQVARARRTPDRAVVALAHQQRQVAAVVEVRVRERHGVDAAFFQARQRGPVAQPQLLVALEQAAIDQQALARMPHQKLGAGDSTGPAQEDDLDAHASIGSQN